MSEQMHETIIEFIKDEYVDEEDMEITATTPLISSGLVDSFSMVSLKMFLEQEYDVKIADDEATTEAFNTVASIAAVVESIKGRG